MSTAWAISDEGDALEAVQAEPNSYHIDFIRKVIGDIEDRFEANLGIFDIRDPRIKMSLLMSVVTNFQIIPYKLLVDAGQGTETEIIQLFDKLNEVTRAQLLEQLGGKESKDG